MFPEQAVRLLVDFLFRRSMPGQLELLNAILDVARWIGGTLLSDGMLLAKTSYHVGDGEAAVELQALLDVHLSGVHATALQIPSWLLPFLLEKLVKLLRGAA